MYKTQEKYEVMFFGPISKTIDQIKKAFKDDPNCFEVFCLLYTSPSPRDY